MINWFVDTLRENPAIAVFLTLGLGFWIGKFKYKNFSLGTVTSVLLVGVLIGQLNIPMGRVLKDVAFLLFLFSIGYSVGPQFFASLKGSGIKQVLFAVVICVLCFLCTWAGALIMGYNVGEAAGLFSGAQTCSAIMGIADDTIRGLNATSEEKMKWSQIVPVAYAVTYIFGTIGSAWILGSLGPAMLGGLDKVRKQTAELAATMHSDQEGVDPATISAWRPVSYRGYKATGAFFDTVGTVGRTVGEIKQKLAASEIRLFLERVSNDGKIVNAPADDYKIQKGDLVVLAGRREYIISDMSWLGPEISDEALLNFPMEQVPVVVSKRVQKGLNVAGFRVAPWAAGVVIASIRRAGTELPVMPETTIERGDVLKLTGHTADVKRAAKMLGYEDRPTTATDMVFVGLAIVVGALFGALTIHAGRVPISLSTSGGALIAGLIFGWLRTKHPTFGFIPEPAVWVFDNLGLNLFIAVIGLASGPTFISGLQQVGWQMLVAGAIVTTVPLILAIIIGDKLFHFHPAINLGCVAGARTTTAALGAIQDSLQSSIPAMSYTVTYAIGNTLLILSGLVMVVLM